VYSRPDATQRDTKGLLGAASAPLQDLIS
jgi:hypothetical protein